MNIIHGTEDELKKWRPIVAENYVAGFEAGKKQFDLNLKRLDIAAMAMQAILSSITIERDHHADYIAQTALKHADALLAEISKEEANHT